MHLPHLKIDSFLYEYFCWGKQIQTASIFVVANNWIWPLKVSHIVPQLSDSDRSQLNYNWIITESRQNDVGVVSHNYCGKTNSPIKIKHMWEHLWYLNLYSSALGNLYCSYFSKKAKKTLSFLEGCPTIDELP